MGKINYRYQDSASIYPSAIELSLDSGEKITVGNSSAGIKIYEQVFLIFPRVIWRCDNVSLIEKCFPTLSKDFIGSPLEQISHDIIERFKSKRELLSYLEGIKV